MATRNHQRALKAIRSLRARHRKQAQQIDILCRDMVSAHRDFSLQLTRLNFAVTFYKTLLSAGGREDLLQTAVRAIRTQIEETGAAVFVLGEAGFEVHAAEPGVAEPVETQAFQEWFTRPLVDQISRTNRVCSLEQLLRMGLQGPPAVLKTLSAAAVPLGRFGQGLGFIFVYRQAGHPLTGEELSRVAAITGGLRDALNRFIDSSTPVNSEK